MSLREEPPEKQNFRTCGRGTGGIEISPKNRWQIQRPENRGDFSTPASIPTRQATTILAGAGDREKNGFGSHSMRFHHQNISLDEASAAPGPGTYGQQPTFHEDSGTKTSLGIKGTGSFASRSRRFRPVSVHGPTPGPGNYDQDIRPAKPQTLEGCQSPSFAVPTSFNPHKSKAQPSPGPCSYNVKESASSARGVFSDGVRDCSAAFQGSGARDPFCGSVRTGEGTMPGPGAYSARSSSTPPGAAARFKGPVQRPVMSVKPGLPTAPVDTADHAGDYVRKVGRIQVETPSVGQYHQDLPFESKRNFSNLGTGSFQKGTSHEPRKWQKPEPSPADYDRPLDRMDRAAKASFTSCSQRSDPTAAGKSVPGPCFYSPKKASSQSFHLNIRQKWL